MEVVITGGQGFLGQELCRYLLKQDGLKDGNDNQTAIKSIKLFDLIPPKDPATGVNAETRVKCVSGDITKPQVCKALLQGSGPLAVFHLAGVMSGQAEKDFDVGLSVNLDGTRNMLEGCRHRGGRPKFVFASSMAVFGEAYGGAEEPLTDTSKIVPKNTYGMTKACGELFVNDYTRKGFVNGRSARLPTVVVRPGLPNAATTSCYSGVVREPLHGVNVVLPVARNLPHSVTGTRTLIKNLVTLSNVAWPTGLTDRSATLPSRPATLQDLIDALLAVVPSEEHAKLGVIEDKEDPFLNGVVSSMNSNMRHDRALQLGMAEVPELSTIVREFIEDFGENVVISVGKPAVKRARTQ